MVNSRAKGVRGELEWASECSKQGFEARRGQQYSGGSESPDVVCDDLDFAHFEVKRVQALHLQDAMDKAITEAGYGRMPVVAHRKNHCDWLVTMTAEDWFKLVREYV